MDKKDDSEKPVVKKKKQPQEKGETFTTKKPRIGEAPIIKEETFEQQQIRLIVEEENEKAIVRFNRRMAKLTDFYFDVEQCKFWDVVNGVLYTAQAVDALIPLADWPTRSVRDKNGSFRLQRIKPSTELQRNENGSVVDCSTWWPGRELLLENELVTQRGTQTKSGAFTYNTYVGPDRTLLNNRRDPEKWIDHVKRLFPNEVEHDHFFDYCAHMLQRPEVKVNHGIVISGGQGIGKDTMLLPLRYGVGLWNTAEIGPDNIEDRFNPFVQSVMLVVNEVRPHNESHRASGFYNRMKPYLAAPPELLPMEMKQCHLVYVRNVMRVFLTTNDYQTMYVPDEDRRLFIMHSFLPSLWANNEYFIDIFDYFKNGGMDAVVNWLLNRDISQFRAGSPPPMTAGKLQVLGSTKMIRRSIINDAFEAMVGEGEEPPVFFLSDLKKIELNSGASFDDEGLLSAAFRHPSLIHKLQELGYEAHRPPEAKVWKWKKAAGEKMIEFKAEYACIKRNTPPEDRFELVDREGRKRVMARVSDGF